MRPNLLSKISNLEIRSVFKLLDKTSQKKIVFTLILQITMGLLDLVALFALGILGSLAVTGIQSKSPSSSISNLLDIFGLSDLSFQSQVGFIGLFAATLMLAKTVFSAIFVRKITFFLAFKSASVSIDLINKFFSLPLRKIQSKSSQETLFALTSGVNSLMLNVLGGSITLISDFSLLIILFIGLLVVDPVMCIFVSALFLFTSILLFRLLGTKAKNFGFNNSMLSIESNNKILEVLNCYREIKVGNRLDFYLQSISSLRRKHSSYTGQLAYLPYVTKYVLESVVVVFALILCSYQFLTKDSIQAISTLVIFMAAGTRMAPAVLRMQQSAISIKTYLGVCKPTLDLAKVLTGVETKSSGQVIPSFMHHGFVPEIIMNKVDFSYGDKSLFRLSDINLKIDAGKFVAVVGPTGAGKSTFADLVLGIQNKSGGQTLISGIESLDALKKWPGAVGYVPQDVFIASGSIRENVAIGFDPEFISDENIWEALDAAQLSTFVRTLPEELSSKIGEGGARLSGGQQQRIGIARALFTKPKILILDEATSSLDAETEEAISVAINKLQGQVTLIVIAHRLSTVKSANNVIYLENGRILAEGKFEDVRRNVPNFDKQAKLMGL